MNKNGESKDWVREVKDGEDAEVDPWTKEKRDKKERVDKNEMARLKNIGMVICLFCIFDDRLGIIQYGMRRCLPMKYLRFMV